MKHGQHEKKMPKMPKKHMTPAEMKKMREEMEKKHKGKKH